MHLRPETETKRKWCPFMALVPIGGCELTGRWQGRVCVCVGGPEQAPTRAKGRGSLHSALWAKVRGST